MSQNSLEVLKRVWEWFIAKNMPKTHWRRYIIFAVATCAFFWGLGILYIVTAPRVYTSSWSLILPGSGVNAKFSLDDIGQASTISNSPFSSKTLSPKVNYKTIISSQNLLKKAAKRLEMKRNDFGKPRVSLIDQTSLINLQIRGSSPQMAQKKAWTLHKVFHEELNRLRNDEISNRTRAVMDSLEKVKINLELSRQKLTDFKSKTGLISLDQFKSTVSTLEKLRSQNIEAKAQLAVFKREVEELSDTLGLQPEQAATLLKLNADLSYKSYTQAHANAKAQYAALSHKFGIRNSKLIEKRKDIINTRKALIKYLNRNYHGLDGQFLKSLFTIDNVNMEQILKQLVIRYAELRGQKAKVEQTATMIKELEVQGTVNNMVASKLEELEREHKIAKAVFSSALARIDSSQADPFASYPLVQVLSEPTLPEKPSSPKKIYTIIGVIFASLFSIMGWTFAWMHQWFLFNRLKKKSFFTQSA